jgi:hypothetical protein
MPTLLLLKGLRFFFYSNENDEPAHVHVTKGSATGKIWLEPSVVIAYLKGFSKNEEKDIIDAIVTHSENFKQKWYEHFRK